MPRPQYALITAALLTLFALAFAAPVAEAARKARPACGLKFLPLVPGAYWVYSPVNPPKGMPPADLTVKVLAVEREKREYKITFEESYRGQVSTYTGQCSRGGLKLPPEAFFLSAEPGQTHEMTIESFVHEGVSYLGSARLVGASKSYEKFTGDVVRKVAEGTTAVHEPAKLELERATTVFGRQDVLTGVGGFRAYHVRIEIQGRVIVGEKEQEVPLREGIMWFVHDIGLVRAREVSGREWKLIETNILPPEQIAKREEPSLKQAVAEGKISVDKPAGGAHAEQEPPAAEPKKAP